MAPLFALVLLQFLPVVQADECVNSLQELEVSLKSSALNMENIDKGFFPLNNPPSIAVNVLYLLNETTSDGIALHAELMNFSGSSQMYINSSTRFYAFQWVSQPVLLPFGPELFELRGLAVFTQPTPFVFVDIPPICSTSEANSSTGYRSEVLLLARLTSKLKWFASSSTHKHTGYVALLHGNGRRAIFSGDSFDISGNLLSRPLLVMVVVYQYTASIGLAMVLPRVFIKLDVLPVSYRTLPLSRTMRNYFWGTIFSTIPASLLMLTVDGSLYMRVQDLIPNSYTTILWLPLPLALPVFFVVNIYFILTTVVSQRKLYNGFARKRPCDQNCLSVMELVVRGAGCVVFTTFCQLLAFHAGWLFPLLIAFPTKVGTLIFLYACCLLSIILFISGMVHSFTANGIAKMSSDNYSGLGWLSYSGFCLAAIYYYTQGNSDDGSRDGIATTMVNLFPIIVAGSLTWIINKYVMVEVGHKEEYKAAESLQEVKKHTSEIGTYYCKKLNNLPV